MWIVPSIPKLVVEVVASFVDYSTCQNSREAAQEASGNAFVRTFRIRFPQQVYSSWIQRCGRPLSASLIVAAAATGVSTVSFTYSLIIQSMQPVERNYHHLYFPCSRALLVMAHCQSFLRYTLRRFPNLHYNPNVLYRLLNVSKLLECIVMITGIPAEHRSAALHSKWRRSW